MYVKESASPATASCSSFLMGFTHVHAHTRAHILPLVIAFYVGGESAREKPRTKGVERDQCGL